MIGIKIVMPSPTFLKLKLKHKENICVNWPVVAQDSILATNCHSIKGNGNIRKQKPKGSKIVLFICNLLYCLGGGLVMVHFYGLLKKRSKVV